MKSVLKIHDGGDHWKIITAEEREVEIFDHTKFYDCSTNLDLFENVRILLESNILNVDKSKLGFEGAYITKYDINIIEVDSINKARASSLETVRNSLSSRMDIFSQLEIFNFVVSNNKLLEKGFIITDNNKDSKFLEIIGTEDDDLISDLEKYLYAKDYITTSYVWYDKYKKFEADIQLCENKEEIEELTNKFLNEVY